VRARVLYRTHYQVDEPALMGLLVRLCASPVRANYTERVAHRMAEEISSRGRAFNVAAAGYAVDLAHSLEILNESNVWTDKGHLLALYARVVGSVNDDELKLDPAETLAYFRLFLEADGAAILRIAGFALRNGEIPADRDWNGFAQQLFREVFAEYLTATADLTDRIALRKEVERVKVPFSGKTGAHKSFLHLQTMARLGLLSDASTTSQRQYKVTDVERARLSALARLIPTVTALEDVLQGGRWADTAAVVFEFGGAPDLPPEQLLHIVGQTYRRVAATGIPLCSLATLTDAVQIELLTSGHRSRQHAEILGALTDLQKDKPREVRFHVDRRGRVAFVKMSEELAQQL